MIGSSRRILSFTAILILCLASVGTALAAESGPRAAEPAEAAEARAETAETRAETAEARAEAAEARAEAAEARAEAAEASPETVEPDAGKQPSETPSKAPPSTPPLRFESAPGQQGPVRRGSTWDLNVDLAYGIMFARQDRRQTGMLRVRGGWMIIHEPWYPSIGLTADISNIMPTSFGIQAEAMHLWTGVWAQIGVQVDVEPRLGFHAAVGYSIIGIEAQARMRSDKSMLLTVFGKVRIPIGFLWLALAN